jgi:hypothetical protein
VKVTVVTGPTVVRLSYMFANERPLLTDIAFNGSSLFGVV